jgi:hypothetical protein
MDESVISTHSSYLVLFFCFTWTSRAVVWDDGACHGVIRGAQSGSGVESKEER